MKIKKMISNKWKISIIDIEQISLNAKQINKILSLFNFNDIIVIIDFLNVNSTIFTEFENQRIEYIKINKYNKDILYAVKLSKNQLDIINSISLDNDLYIVEFNQNHNLENNYMDIMNLHGSKLISDGIINFSIDIWNAEQKIRIESNSLIYDQNELIDRLNHILN